MMSARVIQLSDYRRGVPEGSGIGPALVGVPWVAWDERTGARLGPVAPVRSAYLARHRAEAVYGVPFDCIVVTQEC